MKTKVIVKREILDIVSDKKYMMSLTLQFLLLLAIVPTFSSYLAEEGFTLPAPTMKNFVPIGVMDQSGQSEILKRALLENERLEVYTYDYFPFRELRKGSIVAAIQIPENYDEDSLEQLSIILVISSSNFKEQSAEDAIQQSLSEASAEISARRKSALGIETKDIMMERRWLKPVVIEREGSRYSSFFLGYLIPLILFFPIFMSSSLIVDSVVGEKERKTIEMLLAAPIKRSRIILGKFTAIYGFITLQVLFWLLALRIEGIFIASPIKVFLLLAAINLGLTATAFLLATYSKTVKEANIAMMLLYVMVFVFLTTSLSLEFFNPKHFFELSPFNSLSRLAIGEAVGGFTYGFLVLGLGAYSAVVAIATSRLMERDDVIFGPRPSLFTLLGDSVEGIISKFHKTPAFAASLVAFASGVLAIPLSLLMEVSAGVLFLYIFGYSEVTLVGMILVFAFIEESLKPIALYSLQERRRWITNAKSGAIYGAISGFSFFLLENAFVIFFLFFSFPQMIFRILTLRTGSTLLIHLASSGIVGIGISKSRSRSGIVPFLLLATGIHAIYNLMLLGLVI